MKILVLAPSVPSRTWGSGTRSYYFLKMLAKRHRVTLLCFTSTTEDLQSLSALQEFVQEVRWVERHPAQKRLQQLTSLARFRSYSISVNYSKEMQALLDTLLAQEKYDVVLFESVFVANYAFPAALKQVVDGHNVEYELLKRTFRHEPAGWRKWYNWWESRLLKPAEIALCKKADLVLMTSEQDKRLLQRSLPQASIEVVPNGVDIDIFQSDVVEPMPHQIVFTGAMNYYPNIEAVLTFAKDVWPLIKAQIPEATWIIAGREPPPEVEGLGDLPGVTVTGSVPDVRPYITQSAVAIAPLQIGGGTRLKILEALAMQKAVVSTSIGCEGLLVKHGEHLLVADSPEKFAQAVIQLLRDPVLRASLGQSGRVLVEEEYSWEGCGKRLLQFLEALMQEEVEVC